MMGRNSYICQLVRSLSVAAFVLTFNLQSTFATDPDVTRVFPYGGQVDQQVEVTFSGNRLEDAVEVITFEPGLEITEVTAPEDKKGREVLAKIKVKGDSPLGPHRLRVRTKSGLSEVVTFFVGTLPVIDEKEPNSEFTTPQAIENKVTVHGRIDNEDVDYFTVTAKKGERLSVEVEGLRLGTEYVGGNFFDPYIAILNDSRFELAACDDHALTHQDAFVSIIVPEDGTYYVEIRDSSYGGHGAAFYRLHIGDFPRPTGTVPSGGQPGETLNVKFYGDVAGEFEQQVTLPSEHNLKFGHFPVQNNSVAQTHNRFWISPLQNVIEVEPNEQREQATLISIPSAANGILISDDDVDYFKMEMKKDQQVDLDVVARRVRSSIDSVINVYNDKGGRLAGDDDRKRPDSWVRFKAPADGTYFFQVTDQLNKGGTDFHYRVEVTPVEPKMEITTNDISRYIQPDVEIPQGKRFAILVSIKREDFGGAVEFLTDNLPPGIRLESPASWSNTGVVPLMFHVDGNVDLGSYIARVTGKWTNPNNDKQVLTAPLKQELLQIRGNNNSYVWVENFDVMPVTVTEKVPFDVQIIEPKVPIVRGGVMNLKVVAQRDEGFDEDIQVVILQNPSGVNSSRSIKIVKGQTEALIPLNAAENAAIEESAICVTATARVGNGNISINSPFTMLRVAEKYMNLKYMTIAVEQASPVDLPIEIENLTPFEGVAKVKLIGLPNKTTTVEKEITKETTELVFPITTEAESPVGEHKNLFCQITVMENGEEIVHNIGTGRMRINKPAPVIVAKPIAEPKPEAKKPDAPKPKVLSRIEQLRQQQEALRNQAN